MRYFSTKKDRERLKASAARWASNYSLEEQRVVDYLLEITDNQIGAGDDPIGFLIASHSSIRNELVAHTRLVAHLKLMIEDPGCKGCPVASSRVLRVLGNNLKEVYEV